MTRIELLNEFNILTKTDHLLQELLANNPRLTRILENSENPNEMHAAIRNWVLESLPQNSIAFLYYSEKKSAPEKFRQLKWKEIAAIRILDYLDNTGKVFEDPNYGGEKVVTQPFVLLWRAFRYKERIANTDFYTDMIQLFRQFTGKSKHRFPEKKEVLRWMKRHPSGLDESIQEQLKINKDRIIRLIVRKITEGSLRDRKYFFAENLSFEAKVELVYKWWNEKNFHLRFAARTPDMINEMLGNSLSASTMETLYQAQEAAIPFFVNPYYLSLLLVNPPLSLQNADRAIRDYVLYSKNLVNEFGNIVAWEKEDIVEAGKPNAAGWLLPEGHNIHRRYPEVAILIPDTIGRACAGLCSSCQRMYDFQSGRLNFDLDKLKPKQPWAQKLKRLLTYYENDSQLRDILITGGDALMSSDKSLENILNEVYEMALRKKQANKDRKNGEKYAEMVRIRLGTRLLAYLPQRITPKLTEILSRFKAKASKIGFKQFIIQCHFQSPIEITPEAKRAVKQIIAAGWSVTNQLVFTASAARRGHTAKLRKVLSNIGILPYYTFSVKGFMENSFNFATSARSIQESLEEKVIGKIDEADYEKYRELTSAGSEISEKIKALHAKNNLPFLATDRNVLNMPGVGKSATFRVIGITSDGRRILEFNHDHSRNHSPIIEKMGTVKIIESKSISQFLRQLSDFGETPTEYEGIFGFSIGETENRLPLYEYPEYDFECTTEITNLEL